MDFNMAVIGKCQYFAVW